MDPDRVLDDVPSRALEGKIALITGGSRGIGFAIGEEMARRGASVVLVGLRESAALEAASRLRRSGFDAVGRGCDVSDASAVSRMKGSLGSLVELDVLVCAAGVMSGRNSKTLRTAPDEWRAVMGTNVDGVHHMVAAFVPGMVERRSGRVVTLSACLGRFSGPGTNGGLASYRVSKAAVNAYTKNLAAELGGGRRGVLADAVCPAHCRTDMGGPDAPRSAEQGAATAVWLAARTMGEGVETGVLWEDREILPW